MTKLEALPNKPDLALDAERGTPLRVALVSSSSGSRGGGELYLVGLAQGLAALGHDVQSVLSEHARMDDLARVLKPHSSVHRIRYQNTYDRRLRSLTNILSYGKVRQLSEQLSRLDADVIHVNKQNTEDGLDLLQAARDAHGRILTTIHVTRSMRQLRAQAGLARDWVSTRTLRCIRCPVIAIARSGVDDLCRIGIEPNRLHLVHNGVSDATPADRDEIRRRWGIGPADIVLGCVARLEPQKNPLFLPPLLSRLPRHVRLVWVGDGSQMEALRKRAAEHGVSDRVLLPGWQHAARSLLSAFDIFVLPSLYEGFPFAILEAMAAGLPSVVSDVDGVGEAMIDGQTGFLCRPNDTDQWLEQLQTCIKDCDIRSRLGNAAAMRHREEFSLQAMAGKTAAIYRQIART
jgi:glycosyltransferase involved in cell wall biosynthesis